MTDEKLGLRVRRGDPGVAAAERWVAGGTWGAFGVSQSLREDAKVRVTRGDRILTTKKSRERREKF